MGATVGMYGDLQGIAGESLQEIQGLELPALTVARPAMTSRATIFARRRHITAFLIRSRSLQCGAEDRGANENQVRSRRMNRPNTNFSLQSAHHEYLGLMDAMGVRDSPFRNFLDQRSVDKFLERIGRADAASRNY